jgi:hypothetical protein
MKADRWMRVDTTNWLTHFLPPLGNAVVAFTRVHISKRQREREQSKVHLQLSGESKNQVQTHTHTLSLSLSLSLCVFGGAYGKLIQSIYTHILQSSVGGLTQLRQ